MEQYLMDRFQAMQRLKSPQLNLFGNLTDQGFIDSCINTFEKQEGFALNVEQRAAVRMAATESLSVLTGGAGVGKTTVLKAIFQLIETMNSGIVQMALAGRAAQRMREATGREAYTIIGFLNALKNNKIKLQRNHLIVIAIPSPK